MTAEAPGDCDVRESAVHDFGRHALSEQYNHCDHTRAEQNKHECSKRFCKHFDEEGVGHAEKFIIARPAPISDKLFFNR